MRVVRVAWFERDGVFRAVIVRRIKAAARPLRLEVRCAERLVQARRLVREPFDCTIQDLSTGPEGRDDLAFTLAAATVSPDARRIVLSDDVTLAESILAAKLGACVLSKKKAFDSVAALTAFIVASPAPTVEELMTSNTPSDVAPSARFLDDIERSRGVFKKEVQELERLALVRLMKCETIAEVARRLGDSPSTVRSRMKKMGLSLSR